MPFEQGRRDMQCVEQHLRATRLEDIAVLFTLLLHAGPGVSQRNRPIKYGTL